MYLKFSQPSGSQARGWFRAGLCAINVDKRPGFRRLLRRRHLGWHLIVHVHGKVQTDQLKNCTDTLTFGGEIPSPSSGSKVEGVGASPFEKLVQPVYLSPAISANEIELSYGLMEVSKLVTRCMKMFTNQSREGVVCCRASPPSWMLIQSREMNSW